MPMILVLFYSGEITSILSSPPVDDLITKISDQRDRNYTLYVASKEEYTITSLKHTAALMKNTSKMKMNLQFLFENYVHRDSTDDHLKHFFLAEKKFRIHSFGDVIYLAETVNPFIQQNVKTRKIKEMSCRQGTATR